MLNPNALAFIKKVSENAPTFHLPHHLSLSQNMYSSSEHEDYGHIVYKPFPYQSTLPYPINSPAAVKMDDPCCQYTLSKETWKRKFNYMKKSYTNFQNYSKMHEINLNNGTARIPLHVLKFTRLLRDDPDPYFDSHYNWYLSGNGNLNFISMLGKTYVIKSSHCELNVHSIDHKYKIKECNNHATYCCRDKKLIHETIHQKMSKNDIIGLRQKNKIHLIEYTESENLQHIKTIFADTPFTSMVFDNVDKSIIYSDVDGMIQIYKIDAEETIIIANDDSSKKIKKVNNWSSIQMFDPNSIMLTDKKCVKIFDKRNQKDYLTSRPLFQKECEKITASKICSNNSNLIYLGTIHNLLLYDVRHLKETVLNKWTHGLKDPPLFINSQTFQNKEIVNVCGQKSEDVTIVTHPSKTSADVCASAVGLYYPWHPPNMNRTLKNAQKLGYCLDPTFNLRKRFQMSRMGSVFHTNCRGNINLLTLNSLGDVFSQELYSGHEDIADESTYANLKFWTEQLPKDRFPFVVSQQLNMSNIQSSMKRPSKLMVGRTKSRGLMVLKMDWKNSLKRLNDYEDLWANELLSVWEIDENAKKIDDLVPAPIETKFKIDTWLNQFPLNDED